MFPPPDSVKWQDWRWQMAHCCRGAEGLASFLALTSEQQKAIAKVAIRYPVCVNPYVLSLARTADLSDPILQQVVPSAAELDGAARAHDDPLGEEKQSPVPGVIHRYADRALLLLTNACATHCRHCMRKRRWGPPRKDLSDRDLSRALQYIESSPQTREVILSGGDPLLLPLERLERLLAGLLALDNVEVVRIGSRLPAVLPQRLTAEFCATLGRYAPLWLATQFNHPLELTDKAAEACENLLRAGIPVLNQTVLLRGVNDDADTLEQLLRGLVRMRVKPYYLFHGDPVAGTLHFRTGVRNGLQLMRLLKRRVSGMALPAFALDLPDGGGKIRLEDAHWEGVAETGNLLFRNDAGTLQAYP